MTEFKYNPYQSNVTKIIELEKQVTNEYEKLIPKSYYVSSTEKTKVIVRNPVIDHTKENSTLYFELKYFPLDKVRELLVLMTNNTPFDIFEMYGTRSDEHVHIKQCNENEEQIYTIWCGTKLIDDHLLKYNRKKCCVLTINTTLIVKENLINILNELVNLHLNETK